MLLANFIVYYAGERCGVPTWAQFAACLFMNFRITDAARRAAQKELS